MSADIPGTISIIVTVVIGVIGFLVSVAQDWVSEYRRGMISAFVLLALIGLTAGVIELSNSATAGAKLSSNVAALKRSMGEQSRLAQLNSALQKKLLHQSDVITSLAKQDIGEATGGDSFCYLVFVPETENTFAMVAISKGKFPLRNVTATIVDVREFEQAVRTKPTVYLLLHPSVSYRKSLTIGDLPRESSHSGKELGDYTTNGTGDYRSFNIFFLAINGAWTELARMRRVNGRWVRAVKVVTSTAKSGKARVLFEHVDRGYPEKPSKIDWLR